MRLRASGDDSSYLVSTASAAHRFPSSSFVRLESKNDAFLILDESTACTRALDFTLMLFDSTLSEKTKKLASAAVDELFLEERYRNYVLDIVLAAPLDASADLDEALRVAAEFSHVIPLVRTIIESQPRVQLAFLAWLKLRKHPMLKPESQENILGTLVHVGAFRRLVLTAKTQVDADAVYGDLAFQPGLKDVCEPRILRSFVNDYKSGLELGSKRQRPSSTSAAESETMNGEDRILDVKTSRRQGSSDELADWAVGQVETIADFFRRGQDANANNFLEELIAEQEKGTTDYRHAVKSLCNLSSKCAVVGREELCMSLLQRAFEYETGLDSTAYTLLGDEFRRVKELDKAEDCYFKASKIELNQEHRDEILRKCIRVSIDRGNYDSAMLSYNSIANISDLPSFLTDKGTLYRRMGETQKARECFRNALSEQKDWYQAFAGLAEIYKQRGQLHRSLGAYNKILSTFDSVLDVRSSKIYRLSQAYLYQITKQFDRAKDILSDLHGHYKMDRRVNFQLGKLLVLMGETKAAKPYIQESQRPDSFDLGDGLFSLAMANELSYVDQLQLRDLSTYLPEERGLAACGIAFEAILNGSFAEAWEVTRNASYINRLHHDFGIVLGYHARKQMDQTFNFKSEQPLARIAKRGYRDLRLTVLAINEGNFDIAVKSERCMLQLVA